MTDRRRRDRLTAATVRAVSGRPEADVRGRRVTVADRPVPVVVPYLMHGEGLDQPPVVRRGVADALGLRLRHSDPDLHRRLGPEPPLERVVFDVAEQFRCESLADPALPGLATNTAAAFEHWSEAALAARVAETGVGLLVFTVTHMIRFRLLRRPTSEMVDEVIEITRGNVGRLAGHALRQLPATAGSQVAFAEPAREIARLLAEMVEDAPDGLPEAVTANALLAPIDWDLLDELARADAERTPSVGEEGGYHVYTTHYDVEVAGVDLYPAPVLRRLRRQLDELVSAQAVSVSRLALQVGRLFPTHRIDGWRGGTEDGLLDPARLAQLVADPTNRLVRRAPHWRPRGDGAVTFLVDTSGSMKAQRYESVAVLVDTLVRALELAGMVTEVLGFTTGAWAGGRPRAEWRAAGSPPDPGRLNEVQHLVYKDASQSWREARLGLASMLRTDHYREGIDGEALAWAHRRLTGLDVAAETDRGPVRRLLVVISDGAPMDAATAAANRPQFLGAHLYATARAIETGGVVELGAVGIDLELDDYVTNSRALDLTGTLTIGTYSILDRLFGRHA